MHCNRICLFGDTVEMTEYSRIAVMLMRMTIFINVTVTVCEL